MYIFFCLEAESYSVVLAGLELTVDRLVSPCSALPWRFMSFWLLMENAFGRACVDTGDVSKEAGAGVPTSSGIMSVTGRGSLWKHLQYMVSNH